MGELEILRGKYSQENKLKTHEFYSEVFRYLESSFFIFEQDPNLIRLTENELKEQFYHHNQIFRKVYAKERFSRVNRELPYLK